MTTIISTFGYGVPGPYHWADDHATQKRCIIYIYLHHSGQIIATSHDLTPKGTGS